MRRVLYEAADDRQTVADLARTIANDADPRQRPSSRSAAQASGSPRPAGCNSTTFLPRATTRPTCGPTCARSAAMRSARGRRTRTCNSPCEDQTGGATCFQATSGPGGEHPTNRRPPVATRDRPCLAIPHQVPTLRTGHRVSLPDLSQPRTPRVGLYFSTAFPILGRCAY
jgi:hypothetical protein